MAFDLAADLAARREQHRYREPVIQDGPCGRYAVVEGRRYLNFCSNDYLGLANVLCAGGSWVAPADAVAAGDWARIESLAREAAGLAR